MPYSYDALEPYIDKLTVEIHYSKHHKAYYDNFMNAIKGTEMESMDMKDIFRNISKYPVAVRNNGGGYFNHTFYWESMKAFAYLTQWINEGKIKYTHTIIHGFDKLPDAFIALFSGKNQGKMLVETK